MDFLSDNSVPAALVFGVVVPLSTMAALAIGCGDNRQQAQRKKAKSKKGKSRSASVSGKKSSKSQKSKAGQPPSARGSSKSGKAGVSSSHDSKKQRHKQSAKESSKKASGKAKEGGKDASSKIKEGAKTLSAKVKEGAKDASAKFKEGGKDASKKFKESGQEVQAAGKSAKEAAKEGSAKATTSRSATAKPVSGKPISGSPMDFRLEPSQLFFSSTGGIQQIILHDNSTGGKFARHAVKIKCSDNDLYRVNPVYAFVEPGKSVSLNVYRNSSAASAESKIDKLVLVLAEASREETDPSKPFKDSSLNHPMLVMPLLVAAAPSALVSRAAEATGLCV